MLRQSMCKFNTWLRLLKLNWLHNRSLKTSARVCTLHVAVSFLVSSFFLVTPACSHSTKNLHVKQIGNFKLAAGANERAKGCPLYAAPCQRCNPPPLPEDSWALSAVSQLQQENKNKELFEPQIQRKLQFLLYSNINNLPKQRIKNIQQSSNALKDCHRKAEREKSRAGLQPGVYTIKKLFIYNRGRADQSCMQYEHHFAERLQQQASV